MEEIITLEVYDKRERTSYTLQVEALGEQLFRMVENDIFNWRLALGAEFRTFINKEGKHQIVKIVKESPYDTRRFMLSLKYPREVYYMLGEELVKLGGHWQTDFGGMLTVNLPKDFPHDVHQLIKDLQLDFTEIVDDTAAF